MGVSGGPYIVRDSSLVLELDAADRNSYPGSGTTWRDLTANSNNGTLTNGPTFSSNNLGSIVFDGINDYVNLSAYADSSIFNTTWPNGLTFDIPIKLSDPLPLIVDGRCIFVRTSGAAGANYFNYSIQSTRQLRFWITNGNSAPAFSNTILNTSTIYCTTLVWDRTNAFIYINGSLDSTTSMPQIPTIASSTLLAIGSGASAFSGWEFPGNIYNVKIYNKALSSQEVLQNYNALKSRFNL